MDLFIEQLINGLNTGSIYALIAVGYTMVYGIIRLINFAHGEIMMFGAYFAFIFAFMMPFELPFLLVVIITMIFAAFKNSTPHKCVNHRHRDESILTKLSVIDLWCYTMGYETFNLN
jgi:branched-subunit amino acid ABC-type transport system permease component